MRVNINGSRSIYATTPRRNQPHGGPHSSAIRSYRLKLCPSMPLRPRARFTQHRPILRCYIVPNLQPTRDGTQRSGTAPCY
ncbi:MAG: hypothetical protein VB140_04150 [Burkholderia sp.]